ncbi:Mediator of RNA polymerase II transcription subunit 26 [Bienertia sinuspersici]
MKDSPLRSIQKLIEPTHQHRQTTPTHEGRAGSSTSRHESGQAVLLFAGSRDRGSVTGELRRNQSNNNDTNTRGWPFGRCFFARRRRRGRPQRRGSRSTKQFHRH